MINAKRPHGFQDEVRRHYGYDVSNSIIWAVKRGKRTNDRLLLSIISVEHNWELIKKSRLKDLAEKYL